EPKVVANAEHEVDDVAGVQARVGVIGLDHVAQQERGAAIGVRELERVVQSALAFTGKEGQESDERRREQDGGPFVEGSDRDREADGSEREIDEPGPAEEAQDLARLHTERQTLTRSGAAEIEQDLRSKRSTIERQVAHGG